jgi:hypothetical protein
MSYGNYCFHTFAAPLHFFLTKPKIFLYHFVCRIGFEVHAFEFLPGMEYKVNGI